MKKLVLIAAALASQAALAQTAPGVTADKIRLGQAAVFTGPAAQLGIQMRNGIRAYFDEVNEKGGVHGRKLELVTEDDMYEIARAPAASKKLIEEHARQGGFPANRISEVKSMIDPTTAE